MCTVLLPPGVNPIAVNKYININNVSVRVWWLAGQCERKFSIENQPLRRAKCFADIFKKLFIDDDLKWSNEKNVNFPVS